ncbi:BSD domain [Trypanosoma melophagium]|uniref:BSD domain n=1 Tax=Trypanosoma melophagium TaxID=715481 RepID=UPI00351A267D|nr:BSD domain [Trypanosoma melophagium]
MTSVELISNPTPDVSTHRWNVAGLRHLDRRNKLTSLPFWTPNDVMKKHQFRFVLIRGIVARERESDDYVGLLLELIPPPTGSGSEYPGGCNINVRVVNRLHEGGVHDIEQTETAELIPSSYQVSFPELIPPSILCNPEFVEGDELSILLEVTIQTGVNVTAERVSKTVSSVWATLADSVNKIMQKASKVYSETREEFDVQSVKEAKEPQRLPWEQLPENWVGREDEWRRLITKTMVEDEGTFRYGPNRGFTKDEQALLLQCGLNQRLITNTHAQFNYDRDVHEGLLVIPALRQQRYNLVPGKMKEQVFWANYFWKIAAVSLCKNDEQVRLLLTVINAPPAVKPRDVSTIRTVDEETVLEHVKDAQEAADMLIEYLTDDTPDGDLLVEAAAKACEGHAKQLGGYFKRVDLSEETLKMIGVVLRRLRERLAEYDEYVKKSKLLSGLGENDPENKKGASSEASIGDQGVIPSIQSTELMNAGGETETVTSPKPDDVDNKEASPVSQEQSTDPAKNSTDATTTTTRTTTAAVETTKTVEAKTETEAITTRTTAGAGAGAGDLEFPPMPWEEEDESDDE